MWRLWERAQAAGVDLLWRPCHDFEEVTGHLDRSTNDHAELVLIDVDANDVPTRDVAALRDSLSHLRVPYIEIHDDSDATDAGALAPGHRSKYEAPIAAHNLMRASGAGIQAYRAHGKHEIGVVFNIEPKYPASDSAEDLAATKRAHAYMNKQFADPALLGSYPPELKEIFGDAWPDFPEDDFKLTNQKVDFVGINYYTRAVVKHDADAYPLKAVPVRQPNKTYTETGWEVFEQGLTDTLTWFKHRYGDIPLYITENGSAFYDPPVAENGVLDDPLRTNYLRKHLGALHKAIEAGVNIKGYYAWSLMDNLEWSLGLSKRFGLVHVDFETLERTPKASALFYRDFIRAQQQTGAQA